MAEFRPGTFSRLEKIEEEMEKDPKEVERIEKGKKRFMKGWKKASLKSWCKYTCPASNYSI